MMMNFYFPSFFSGVIRGEVKIHDDEWQKLADALEVPVEDIKEEKELKIVHNDNSTFNDNSGNYYNQHFNIPNILLDSLQDYITILKEQNTLLKQENQELKSKLNINKE